MAASGCAGRSSLDRRGSASSTPGTSGSNWLKHQELNLPTKSNVLYQNPLCSFLYLISSDNYDLRLCRDSWLNAIHISTVLIKGKCHWSNLVKALIMLVFSGWKVAVSWGQRYVWWSLMDTLINWYTWLALPLLGSLWSYPNTLRREVYSLDFWKIASQWTVPLGNVW